jgi:peptidyl-prolyl cis-trans isomerase C
MKRRVLYASCLAALLAGAAASAQETDADAGAKPGPETTIATINGQDFSLGIFRLFYAERLRQQNAENTPELQNQVFNEFVNIVVTAQDALGKGLDKEEGVQNALELQRIQLLSRLALQDAARTETPSDETLQAAYEERYGGETRQEYKARHILVKAEDEAKKLIEELEGGADFSELAKTHSLGPTGKNGGDLGWFDSKQMVKPFTEAVQQMEPGSHSQAPVQTQFGWHVILLEEAREAEPPPLESVKGELSAGMQRETLSAYVAALRQGAELELNSDLIKTSPAEESEEAQGSEEPESPAEAEE